MGKQQNLTTIIPRVAVPLFFLNPPELRNKKKKCSCVPLAIKEGMQISAAALACFVFRVCGKKSSTVQHPIALTFARPSRFSNERIMMRRSKLKCLLLMPIGSKLENVVLEVAPASNKHKATPGEF